MQVLTLRNAQLSADILPAFGAGLASLDWVADGQVRAVMRGLADRSAPPRPNQLACFPLLPWSNRMAGGFRFDGRHYPIPPNRVDDPYPMHGDAWQLPWSVAEQSDTRAVLLIDRRRAQPFSYEASLSYTLDGAALTVTLEVCNRGASTLPFGLGLHPWLPRSAGLTLQAAAQKVWLAGADRLPTEAVEIPAPWSFAAARILPEDGIDHIFEGWDGHAAIRWPATGMGLDIDTDCGYYILYAPAGGQFFCVEPVDHMINAHNLEGGPVRHGLSLLAPGQSLRRSVRFTASASAAPRAR